MNKPDFKIHEYWKVYLRVYVVCIIFVHVFSDRCGLASFNFVLESRNTTIFYRNMRQWVVITYQLSEAFEIFGGKNLPRIGIATCVSVVRITIMLRGNYTA